MKIALVTNSGLHHSYWLKELYSKFEVCAVVIVKPKSKQKVSRQIKELGIIWLLLKVCSTIFHRLSKRSYPAVLKKMTKFYFSGHSLSSGTGNTIKCADVNESDVIKKIKDASPDVICFLGGDIARSDFFKNTRALVLNYHSGLSPFYNGSATTFQAVANSRPNFCGGTLMVMNEVIDGGDILSYYLTPIESNDTAASLFCKGIIGCVELYTDFLVFYAANRQFNSIPQERSALYYKASHWTILEDLRLRVFEKSKKMAAYQREAKIMKIYNRPKAVASEMYAEVLNLLLAKKK